MTNKIIQQNPVTIEFILSEEETDIWTRRDWKAAGIRGGVKREARSLFRDTGGAVTILGSGGVILWDSDSDPVCAQMIRNQKAGIHGLG